MAYHGNSWEKKLIKVTFQSGDDTMSWETLHWDEPLENIIRGFAGLLVSDGYSESDIAEMMVQYGITRINNPKEIYTDDKNKDEILTLD